ncbi:MAG: ABC transporter substrate-binding protein [Lentisphaerae bacterium]|nr:ABC transporter substrate-binding protein [Lentisphaerota bacterium]MCP4103306.1 ABC transporter substrate-binding protein [Lentisphaerota bacterium]
MKNIKFAVLCFLLFFSAVSMTAALKNPLIIKETQGTLLCRDYSGKQILLHKKPKRVIIGYTSLVGVWYCAGGKAIAIPTTLEMHVENLPEVARKLPRIGSFSNLNLEKIISMKPDLVILPAFRCKEGVRDILNESGIENIVVNYSNYTDFRNVFGLFCHLNGTTLQSNKYAADISSAINKLIVKAGKKKSPSFVSIFYNGRGLACETSKANSAQIAGMLNGNNLIDKAAAGLRGSRIPFSLEKIIMDDPDIILFTTMCNSKNAQNKLKKELFSDPAWKELSAVKNNRVYLLPNRLFLYKANERYPDAFRYMAKILYPLERWD